MKTTIKLKDLFVQDIVEGMAESFQTSVKKENNITRIEIPENIGSGFVEAHQFASGIGLINTKYSINNTVEFDLEKSSIQPLKVIFNLGDDFEYKHCNNDDFKIIKNNCGLIVTSCTDNNLQFRARKFRNVHLFSIEINRSVFNHKIENFKFDLDDRLTEILTDTKGLGSFAYNFNYSAQTLKSIRDIEIFDENGFLGALYREGKVYEVLTDTLRNFLNKGNFNTPVITLNNRKRLLVKKVCVYIESNLSKLPTVADIARKFYTNTNILQESFKVYLHCSVHDFIANKRLEKARELLETTDYNITEITYKIGINSKSYFSKIFKDRYGVSPSKYKDSQLFSKRFY